ncbi:uncharacterized protein LOC128959805 [Oppia nitens]|uniref:uncharacterized protein LOC128959805 n=1 Tax=Oppia nitens TaxID=1686743 RepID=UPI0023DC6898|nr:uncharacterized protein LOC128959805 [Oppia nitens]
MMTNNNNNMSSFDRFGDDLAALILTYLPFEDQLRLECVSKQFQSCGIQRQTSITSDVRTKMKFISKSLTKKKYFDNNKWLSLMKRCPNVQSVDMSWIAGQELSVLRAIHRLRTIWPQLRRIDCNIDDLFDGKDIQFLCKEFPEMISKIDINNSNRISFYDKSLKPYLPSMTNLRHLFTNLIDQTFIGKQLVVTGLHGFSCHLSDNMESRFALFINDNRHLKYLSLKYKKQIVYNKNSMNTVLSIVGQFKQLKQLDLSFKQLFDYSIRKPLITIAYCCLPLKSFKLHMKVDSVNTYMETYSAVKHMNQLKRLDLKLTLDNNNQMIDRSLYASLQPVDCWPQLTHLKLNLSHMDYQLFTDLDRNLPKLQYLTICDPLGVCDGIFMSYISRLSSLIKLTISTTKHLSISESDVHRVINGCLKLIFISISVTICRKNSFIYNEKLVQSLRTTSNQFGNIAVINNRNKRDTTTGLSDVQIHVEVNNGKHEDRVENSQVRRHKKRQRKRKRKKRKQITTTTTPTTTTTTTLFGLIYASNSSHQNQQFETNINTTYIANRITTAVCGTVSNFTQLPPVQQSVVVVDSGINKSKRKRKRKRKRKITSTTTTTTTTTSAYNIDINNNTNTNSNNSIVHDIDGPTAMDRESMAGNKDKKKRRKKSRRRKRKKTTTISPTIIATNTTKLITSSMKTTTTTTPQTPPKSTMRSKVIHVTDG